MANKIQIKHGSGVPGPGKLSSFELGYATQTGQLYISTNGSNILGITPSSHSHAWAEVTGKPATAIRWPTWSEVTDKPALFPITRHVIDTPSSGWYRVAQSSGGGRGAIRIGIYSTGGSWTPMYAEIFGFHNWNANAYIPFAFRTGGYVTQARYTADGTNTYLECYFSTGFSGYLVMHEAGYNTYTAYSGTLPSGGGTVHTTKNIASTIWDNENDGSGSGLDADLLDGQHASSFSPSSHTHTIANVTNLQTTLDGKASSSHTHTIANVTNLQTTLNGKAPSSHTHTKAQIPKAEMTLLKSDISLSNNGSTTFTDSNQHTIYVVYAYDKASGVTGWIPAVVPLDGLRYVHRTFGDALPFTLTRSGTTCTLTRQGNTTVTYRVYGLG